MSLAITHEPTDISLSKNVIYYSLANGLFGGRGVQAEYITPDTKLPNGNTLTINWTDVDGINYSLTFTAVSNPIQVNQIQNDTTVDDFYTWFQGIADKIQAHPQIAPFFKLSIGNDDPYFPLTIEALEIDDSWIVEFDNTGVTVPGTSTSQNLTIIKATLPENYKIHLEVFFEKTYLENNWERVAKLKATPADINNVSFQINEVLHSEIKKSYSSAPIPATDLTEPYLADNLRRYYVRFTEESGSPAVKDNWENGDVNTLLCGGIGQDEFAKADFFSGLNNANSLLTNFPDSKEVSKTQPNYLSFFNYDNEAHTVNLRIFIYDEENVQTNFVTPFLSIEVLPNQTVIFPIGYNQLGLETSGVDIKYYKVHVIDGLTQGIDYSQTRTILVDDSHQEHERFLLYLNAFCLPEVIRCIGELSSDLIITREESTKILPPDYSTTAEEVFQHNEDFEIGYTYRTGFLNKAEKEALQEMLIYNDVFEILESGYLALYITDKKFKIVERDRQNRFTLQFKTKPRLKKKITNDDLLVAPTNWIDPTGEAWITSDGDSWIFN